MCCVLVFVYDVIFLVTSNGSEFEVGPTDLAEHPMKPVQPDDDDCEHQCNDKVLVLLGGTSF